MKNYIKFLIFITISILFGCKKDSTTPSNNNQIFTFSENFNSPDSLVSIVDWKEKGLIFYYYGEKENNTSNISKINAVSFYKADSKDTVYNFTLDESQRVKSFYKTIRGVKDSLIAKYSYQDSLLIISVYHIDWGTNSLIFRGMSKINTNNYTITYPQLRISGPNYDLIKLATIGTLLGGIYLVSAGAALFATAPLLAIVGGLVGIYAVTLGLNALWNFTVDKLNDISINVGKLFDSLLPSAGAAELDEIPIGYNINHNPTYAINNLYNSNMEWRLRIYYVSYIAELNGGGLHIVEVVPVEGDIYKTETDNNLIEHFPKDCNGNIIPGGERYIPGFILYTNSPICRIMLHRSVGSQCAGNQTYTDTYVSF